MRIVTEVVISSAHNLPYYEGKCKNLHGHNWKVKVCLDGKRQTAGSQTGMLWDFGEVRRIINKLDHVYLNDLIKNPTAENISEWITKHLWEEAPEEIESIIVQVYETEKSYAQFSSEELPADPNGELEEVLDDLEKEREVDKDVGSQCTVEDDEDEDDGEDKGQ